jgi:hypothetical protein
MKVLFKPSGEPHSSICISYCLASRERHYAQAIQELTRNTEDSIDIDIFLRNAVRFLVSSKMTRRGPFQGVRLVCGGIYDPEMILEKVWAAIGKSIVDLKSLLLGAGGNNRPRILIETPAPVMDRIVSDLWRMFKKLLPLCLGVNTLGLTAASKILFSIFPEIAIAVEKNHWNNLFQTVDYTDVIGIVRAEITEWERRSQKRLNDCDPHGSITLPVIYNAVALRMVGEKMDNHIT